MATKDSFDPGDHYYLVAAIDFGTTFTGYAYSFKSEPEVIRMNKNWGEGQGFQSYKTPTSVLIGPRGRFEAFGFEAEKRYTDFSTEGEDPESYQLFRHFKMMLYKQKHITRETEIMSVDGHSGKALDIFSMALHYIRDHLIESIRKATYIDSPEKLNEQIKWVLTVPAIWDDQAKQFMREAACMAGLIKEQNSKMLMIALEPEAASMYCRKLDIDHFACGPGEGGSLSFDSGTKYMVIDAGGGTVDITVHEILPNGHVKELHTANGGAWGGTQVDKNFTGLLKEILTPGFVDIYMRQYPDQWLALMTNFERVKCSVTDDGNSKLLIPLSWSIGSKHQEIMGTNIERVINGAASIGVKFSNGAIILQKKAIDRIFLPVVENIIEHIHGLMKLPNVKKVKYLMLVGGFGECAYLQHKTQDEFGSTTCLLVPCEAQMAVKKGAVLFGHQPTIIQSRISRYTYGVKIRKAFIRGVHDESKRYVSSTGEVKCRGIFDPFLRRGEEVESGSVKSVLYHPSGQYDTGMKIDLYRTEQVWDDETDLYVDSPGMENVGLFYVDMPNAKGGKSRGVRLDVLFGGTEIEVSATDTTSGSQARVTIDFLAD